VQRIANAAYLEGFPFPALLRVAPYCVRGGIRVVSNRISYWSAARVLVGLSDPRRFKTADAKFRLAKKGSSSCAPIPTILLLVIG
jgi:hypothetical protein